MKFSDIVVGRTYLTSDAKIAWLAEYKNDTGVLFTKSGSGGRGSFWDRKSFDYSPNFWIEQKPKRYQVLLKQNYDGRIWVPTNIFKTIEETTNYVRANYPNCTVIRIIDLDASYTF